MKEGGIHNYNEVTFDLARLYGLCRIGQGFVNVLRDIGRKLEVDERYHSAVETFGSILEKDVTACIEDNNYIKTSEHIRVVNMLYVAITMISNTLEMNVPEP